MFSRNSAIAGDIAGGDNINALVSRIVGPTKVGDKLTHRGLVFFSPVPSHVHISLRLRQPRCDPSNLLVSPAVGLSEVATTMNMSCI